MINRLKYCLIKARTLFSADLGNEQGLVVGCPSGVFFDKAVIVRVSQGLANQMICYKTAKLVASWMNATIILDASPYGSINNRSNRNFQLHHHRIKYDMLVFDRSFSNRLEQNNKVFRVTKEMLYPESGKVNPELIERIKSESIVYFDFWLGLFLRAEADRFAEEAGVLSELELKYEDCFGEADYACLKKIQSAVNPVAIHVRRGDYATHNGGMLLTSDYFNRSIKSMEEDLGGLSVFVFSDDISWCRENIDCTSQITFVDWNDDTQGYKDLFLGSRCKHFIISNDSTFSHQMIQLSRSDPGRMVITSTHSDLLKNAV